MSQLLGLMILSAAMTGILIVPFIDMLYKVKLKRKKQVTTDMFNKPTPIFDKYNSWKVGTPFGGGLLIIAVVTVLALWSYGLFNVKINIWEIFVLLFGFISFGMLGLYDDVKKLVDNKESAFWGLRFRHKFIIQWILAVIISSVMYLKLNYTFIFITGLGLANIGILFIPIAAFVIVSFVNSFNIADGLDGQASGLLIICLGALLIISASQLNETLGIFISILIGSVGAFLYFNIYKARLWLGDVGSLSLGAALAIVGLLTGKIIALAVIGGVFVLEVGSSLIQLLSKKFLGRKVLPAAPFHLWLLKRGWEGPKIVMRLWLFGFFFAILGLYIALNK